MKNTKSFSPSGMFKSLMKVKSRRGSKALPFRRERHRSSQLKAFNKHPGHFFTS